MIGLFTRIISKAWLQAFFAALFTLLLLMTIGGLLSGFLRNNVTPFQVLVNHVIQIFDYISKLFPVSALVASLFALNHLVNRNELTALFALGMTRVKLLTTIFLLASAIAVIQIGLVGFGQPYVIKKGRDILQDASKKFANLDKQGIRSSTLNTGRTWFRNKDYFFSFETFDPIRKTLNAPVFYMLHSDFSFDQTIKAKKAVFIRKGKWKLENCTVMDKIADKQFTLVKNYKEYFISIEETPDSFKQIEADIKVLDLKKLYRYVKKLKFAKINTAMYEVILYHKISSALLTILFALLSAMAVFKPNRRSSSFGKNIFFVISFTIVYWLVDSYMTQLGTNNIINPFIAIFALPCFFIIYLAIFYYRNRKIAS